MMLIHLGVSSVELRHPPQRSCHALHPLRVGSIPKRVQIRYQSAHICFAEQFSVSGHLSFDAAGDYLTNQRVAGAQVEKIGAFVAARVETVAFRTMFGENSAALNRCFAANVAQFCWLRL